MGKEKNCLTVFDHANVHMFNHPDSDKHPMSFTIHDVENLDIHTTYYPKGAHSRAFKCIKLEVRNERGQTIEVNLFMKSEEAL